MIGRLLDKLVFGVALIVALQMPLLVDHYHQYLSGWYKATQSQVDGYAEHYSKANAYVLIPAFQAAIEGKSPTKNNNLEKSKFPMPNWRITYSGIKNIHFINSQFAMFDISYVCCC